MKMKPRWTLLLVLIALLVALSGCGTSTTTSKNGNANKNAGAENTGKKQGDGFPNKEITIVVSNKAGGSNDLAARSIVPSLQKVLGVPIVIKNVDTAGGNVARAEVFRGKPDGYTLLETPMPSMGIGEIIQKGDFKTLELTPVFNLFGKESDVIVVASNSPIKSINDLIQASKAKKLKGSGSGTATNAVLGSIFLKNIGVNHQYISFKGGTEAVQQVAGGHVDFGTSSEISALPLEKEGKIRVLASTGPERSQNFPNAPTLVELGYKEAQFNIIYGFWAPPGTPKNIVDKLAAAFNEASKDKEFQGISKKAGFTVQTMMPDQFGKAVEESYNMVKNFKQSFDIK